MKSKDGGESCEVVTRYSSRGCLEYQTAEAPEPSRWGPCTAPLHHTTPHRTSHRCFQRWSVVLVLVSWTCLHRLKHPPPPPLTPPDEYFSCNWQRSRTRWSSSSCLLLYQPLRVACRNCFVVSILRFRTKKSLQSNPLLRLLPACSMYATAASGALALLTH